MRGTAAKLWKLHTRAFTDKLDVFWTTHSNNNLTKAQTSFVPHMRCDTAFFICLVALSCKQNIRDFR